MTKKLISAAEFCEQIDGYLAHLDSVVAESVATCRDEQLPEKAIALFEQRLQETVTAVRIRAAKIKATYLEGR